jgi:hypothetical protein
MHRHSLALLALFPLFACASSRAKDAPVPELAPDTYAYRVAVPAVPADARQVVVTVELPGPVPPRVLSLHGLVGNAPFDMPIQEGDNLSFSNEQVSVSLAWVGHSTHTTGTLLCTTHGKPLELGLRLGVPSGTDGAGELGRALVEHTSASADGRPIEAVATRFERVK